MPRRPCTTGRDATPEDVWIRIRDVPPTDTVPARLILLAQILQKLFDDQSADPARRNPGAGKLGH